MSKPQLNHLATIIEDNINIEGKISISKIAENIDKSKDQSCICRFLSNSPWDDKLLNHNRLGYLQHLMDHNLSSNGVSIS